MQKTVSLKESSIHSACYHCGENCPQDRIICDDHSFCCQGCKLVYEVLRDNNLCNYYDLNQQPGQTIKTHLLGDRYAYLDEEQVAEKLITFREGNIIHLQFHIPSMHCSSCIWLLENLPKIIGGVLQSAVNFVHKQISIVYDADRTSLRKIVETLAGTGYEPELNLDQVSRKVNKAKSRIRIYRIGVAGFAFGNIMLLSFPEYFSDGLFNGITYSNLFGYLNLFLSLPVFFFSAWEFIGGALRSFRQKAINIDVPLALGIVAVFLRSVYEVLSGTGPGYFDSMTGLVFFMLIGRNFQDKTFNWLSYENDYRSYLPVAVTKLTGTKKMSVTVNELKINDRILLRNQDIIPADVTLLNDAAEVDYSFITGESKPHFCNKGEHIFAGARLLGNPVEAVVLKEVSQSYITSLWNNNPSGRSNISGFSKMTSAISKWFIVITISIAVAGFAYWYPTDATRAINAFTSVLVIACACALALSAPFALGNMLRILGKNGIYLRNTTVIERLADISTIAFDKTGTLTDSTMNEPDWKGKKLNLQEFIAIKSVAAASNHPNSQIIENGIKANAEAISDLLEVPGQGISAKCGQLNIHIGRPEFCFAPGSVMSDGSAVHIAIDGQYKGHFSISGSYRKGIDALFSRLKYDRKKIVVLSGDTIREKERLKTLTGLESDLSFDLSPEDKRSKIAGLQVNGDAVMMVGDGINDAVALRQSDVGLAVSADVNNFNPACDGIIAAENVVKLDELLRYSRSGIRIIIISFIISLFYNLAGLYFAVTGTLSPMIAAILMPVSTISLVLFTVLSSSLMARKYRFGR